MAWHLRFWRRLRVAPGVSVNMSKSGLSVSVGPRGSKVTVGRRGIRRTIGIPGTGIYATNQEPWSRLRRDAEHPEPLSMPDPEIAQAEKTPVLARRCGFCGGRAGADRRCEMCGQPIT